MNTAPRDRQSLHRLHFFTEFLRDPAHVGAISPTSLRLGVVIGDATRAAAMNGFNVAGRTGPDNSASGTGHATPRIIELGAGTGSLSRHISAMNPVLIERNREWAALLRKRFPYLEVRAECATHTLAKLDEPVGVVSSIPLLNNPQSADIKQLLGRKYQEGLIRFCILYTYGWNNPLAGVGFGESRREHFVSRSVPPAWVWVYR